MATRGNSSTSINASGARGNSGGAGGMDVGLDAYRASSDSGFHAILILLVLLFALLVPAAGYVWYRAYVAEMAMEHTLRKLQQAQREIEQAKKDKE